MPTIILRLIPSRLSNPDLDLRYVLPDVLAERSGGLIEDGGYEYEDGSDALLIYVRTEDPDGALAAIASLVEGERVPGNDLREGMEVVVRSWPPSNGGRQASRGKGGRLWVWKAFVAGENHGVRFERRAEALGLTRAPA